MTSNREVQVVDVTPIATDGQDSGGSILEIDLRLIYMAIHRNFLWIVAIIIGTIGVGVIGTLLMVPRYIATSKVLIEQQADEIIEGSDLNPTASLQDADRFLQTQLDVIQSRALARRIMQAEHLASNPEFFKAVGEKQPDESDLKGRSKGARALEELREETALDLLQENLTTNLPTDSRLAEINFESTDPVLSARLSNAFAENYIASNLERKFGSSLYAREFLAQQLAEARANLEQAERDLNQYSRAAGLIRVTGQGQNADQETTLSVTNDTLVQLNLAASQATAERVAAQERWEAIASTQALSIPQVLANQAIQDLIRQRSEASARLAEEQARHLDGHPSVQALRNQVNELNGQIDELGTSIKRSVRVEFEAARDREAALRSQVSSIRTAALDEQDRGVQYNVLKRVAETSRSLYDSLLERYNALNANAGATSNNISIVDRADVPRRPSSPNIPINLALATLAGCAVAAAFVFLREHFDDALRSPDDVEMKLGLPMLGLVPRVMAQDIDAEANDSKSLIHESYSALVANLRWATASGLPRSLAITSAQAQEGKTTSARAVAIGIAKLGRRVLLIDADLRRPTLHRYSGKTDQPGLTAVIGNEGTIADYAYASEHENLSYLTALPTPHDPAMLLGSPRVAAIFEEARAGYDCVVIDCPPMLGLSDAANIAVHAEGVIMIIDGSKSHRGAVKSSLRRLRLVRAKILGAVLCKFDPNSLGPSYAYYGYNYYSYGKEEAAA